MTNSDSKMIFYVCLMINRVRLSIHFKEHVIRNAGIWIDLIDHRFQLRTQSLDKGKSLYLYDFIIIYRERDSNNCGDNDNDLSQRVSRKVYGINEIAPDFNLLNKRPHFSENFQHEILSNISKKRDYNKAIHRFLLRIPPEEEMKVRFESRFENANLK